MHAALDQNKKLILNFFVSITLETNVKGVATIKIPGSTIK